MRRPPCALRTIMRVLLINPPIEDFFFTPARAYPLGILYLGAVLKKEGFCVKLLNSLEGNKKFPIEIPEGFKYLKRYYHANKSPFCLFSHYYHFGMRFAEIEKAIRDFAPQVVGVCANFSPYFETALEVAQISKKIDKRIMVVLGGRFSTAQPKTLLARACVDFVIRGEAEYSILELCRNFESGNISGIKGLCYRRQSGMHISEPTFIEDLNKLPIPARELIAYKEYTYRKEASTALIASRGCNLGCSFCAITEKFRFRRAENVLAEIESCIAGGIRHFNFEDDNINCNPEFEKIIDALIDKFPHAIKVSFMNGLLAKGITARLRDKLIKAGLTHLDFSLISAQNSLRQQIKRKEKTSDIFSSAEDFAKKGIRSTVHFIVGLPNQTFASSLRDVRLLASSPATLGPSIFYPVLESAMFAQLKELFSHAPVTPDGGTVQGFAQRANPESKAAKALRPRSFTFSEKDYRYFRSSAACFDKKLSRERIFFIFYLSRLVNFIKELIEKLSLDEGSFFDLLKNTTAKYRISKNTLIVSKKIDREELGLVILNRLLNKHVFLAVSENKISGKFHYIFSKEEFISCTDIRKALAGLTIKSASGARVTLQ
ncbi:MAG: radical SAM protein [Candidatus Omnitrophica bacterium]|nr:radical SAM protein [Candidatus Omnitrophota bacterium]